MNIFFQSAFTCLLLLSIWCTLIIIPNQIWFAIGILILLDVSLIGLLIWQRRDHFLLSWIIVSCCIILLIAAPISSLTSLAILLLFLCYTLLPLQIFHSIIAAIFISFTAIIIRFISTKTSKQVSIFINFFYNVYIIYSKINLINCFGIWKKYFS